MMRPRYALFEIGVGIMGGRLIGTVVGAIVSAVGALWILQGFDLIGQTGGMNGHRRYAAIGAVVAIAGLAIIAISNRRWLQSRSKHPR